MHIPVPPPRLRRLGGADSPAAASGSGWLGRLFGLLLRLGADGLLRRRRLDADRPADGNGGLGLGGLGIRPEVRPAARREAGPVAGPAGPDPTDARKLRAPQMKSGARAAPLPFGGVGKTPPCKQPKRK